MAQLLVATTNPAKLKEIRLFLSDLPVELLGLSDISSIPVPVETGLTFEENAKLKALYYSIRSKLPAISDDGGLEIDALGGEPGIHSHRWIHKDRDDEDEELIDYTLARMNHLPLEQRGAQMVVALAFALPTHEVFTAKGVVRGFIPLHASKNRTKGFPYRSLLFIPEINKFYDHNDMTLLETEKYNHRKMALDQLKKTIQRTLR